MACWFYIFALNIIKRGGCLSGESLTNQISLNGASGIRLPFVFHSFEHLGGTSGVRTLTNDMQLLLTMVL